MYAAFIGAMWHFVCLPDSGSSGHLPQDELELNEKPLLHDFLLEQVIFFPHLSFKSQQCIMQISYIIPSPYGLSLALRFVSLAYTDF